MKSDLSDRGAPPVVAHALRDMLSSLRIALLTPHHVTAEDRMMADLRRLAETSPHLLEDIGFRRTRCRVTGRVVWTRLGLRLEDREARPPPGAAWNRHDPSL